MSACPICDRPECRVSELGLAAHTDAAALSALTPAMLDCDAHRINWRNRALTAEATYGRDTIALAQQRNAANERALTAEAAARAAGEKAGRLEELLIGAIARVRFHALAGSGGAQATLNVVERGYAALAHPATEAPAPRNAAERGEAFAKSHDVAQPGREAEELRRGIEALIEQGQGDSGAEVLEELQNLVDLVDARDSLAFLDEHSESVMKQARRDRDFEWTMQLRDGLASLPPDVAGNEWLTVPTQPGNAAETIKHTLARRDVLVHDAAISAAAKACEAIGSNDGGYRGAEAEARGWLIETCTETIRALARGGGAK